MNPRYRLTPTAQENVDAICAFIAQDSVDAALRVWDSLEHAFEQLARHLKSATDARTSRVGR